MDEDEDDEEVDDEEDEEDESDEMECEGEEEEGEAPPRKRRPPSSSGLKKSAAGLCVSAGSFSDPPDMPGRDTPKRAFCALAESEASAFRKLRYPKLGQKLGFLLKLLNFTEAYAISTDSTIG